MSNPTGSVQTLYVCDSSAYRPATAEETLSAARRAISQQFRRGRVLSSPAIVREYLRMRFATLEHEVFGLVLLDARHQLIAFAEMFRGTVDGAAVHPREVVKEVLRHNAAAVILTHNHPSGQATFSHADEMISHRLRDALALVDVRVIDHVLVAGDNISSMAELGLL